MPAAMVPAVAVVLTYRMAVLVVSAMILCSFLMEHMVLAAAVVAQRYGCMQI